MLRADVLALVRVAVALGSDDSLALAPLLSEARAAAGAAAVDEVLLQSYLFVGYPRVLNAFRLWRSIEPEAPAARGDEAEWEERGQRVLSQVYGGQDARVVANVQALHPDLARWMVTEGYGKVLGRPGLDLGVRELCIVALLATQDAVPQLYSHLRGSLNAGMAMSDVEEALALALTRAPDARRARALDAWDAVKSRRGG
ncbi:MAG TPA: carboxymuconolactone decarboxylase family protein [Longimicrobiales bacterium]